MFFFSREKVTCSINNPYRLTVGHHISEGKSSWKVGPSLKEETTEKSYSTNQPAECLLGR